MLTQKLFVEKIIEQSYSVIEQNKALLTELDLAIGDGDHGTNISRGFKSLKEKTETFSDLPFDQLCKQAGMALVMSVGGASGPLFGSCVMAFGINHSEMPNNLKQVASMISDGADAVKARGKSDVGAKTMLDVLVPFSNKLQDGRDLSFREIREIANNALQATKPMEATKGRAAFLGERSIGHIDPGAQTVVLLVNSVCEILEANP